MRNGFRIAVIIPALDEERSIGKVIAEIPQWVDEVIVADNGSTDRTAEVAGEHGARVVREPRKGYGSACLAGMAAAHDPDIMVFMDGDYSDYPEEAALLVDPIISGQADMVLGSRVLGEHEPGALTPQAIFGNWLACRLMQFIWNAVFTDLGPFRAISFEVLKRLDMRDPDYGWTVEMQIKAVREGFKVKEVPVSYRRRVGTSKVSGTVKGVIGAGTKILGTIFLALTGLLPVSTRKKASERIILFTRYPEPGKTKTRMIPVLGPDGAAELHRRMTEHTLDRLRQFDGSCTVDLEVFYDGGNELLMRRWLGPDLVFMHQGPGDLGQRMFDAFRRSFREGADRIVLVGSDIPELTENGVARALRELRRRDLVLGPTTDGGYCLVGLRRPCPELFDNVPWGTERVLETTLKIANRLGLSYTLLPPLHDVDRPKDLRHWEDAVAGNRSTADRRSSRESGPRISVIIPTLNEESIIDASLNTVKAGRQVEVIVVDGGSRDRTVQRAQYHGVRVVVATGGRSRQMNMGASQASGEIFLFLHADTRLPVGWNDHVLRTLRAPGTSAGAFLLAIGGNGSALRIIERMANLRSRSLQMPYGDQAIFLKRDFFERIGGFPEIPIMEDFVFVRRARNLGRVRIAPVPVVTSARRWKEQGPWKTTLINQLLLAGHRIGVPVHELFRVYHTRHTHSGLVREFRTLIRGRCFSRQKSQR